MDSFRTHSSLEKTADFIELQWNENITESFFDSLDERIEQLKTNPKIGSKYQDMVYRLLHINPLVTLFYQRQSNQILLTLFLVNKQNPDKLKNY